MKEISKATTGQEWQDTIYKLFKAFPDAIINNAEEFIAHREKNEYFRLKDCKTREDVQVKVLAYLSRGACKTIGYDSNRKNEQYHKFMRDGINKFLATKFSHEDMELIYTRLGNGCNRELSREFIQGGFDMAILEDK